MANKLILFTGDRDGVGKTTLAVNLAARLSQIRHQPVAVIDSDPLCRNESAQAAGTSPGTSVMQFLDQLASQQLSWPMMRGRLSTNASGIGVINLAAHARDAQRLVPEQWGFFLQGFSQFYDAMIDMDALNPLFAQTIDLADAVVWSFLPNALSLRGMLQNLETLHNQKFSFNNFIFALNLAGTPQSLSEDMILRGLERFGKAIDLSFPFEPEIPKLLNQGRAAILDHRRYAYSLKMTTLAEMLGRFTRDRTPGFSSLAAGGASKPGTTPRALGTSAAQTAIVDKILLEKQQRWNKFKQQIHRELVDEMNIRRIDLDTKGDPVRERQLRTNVESTVNSLIATKEKDFSLAHDEREQLVKELVDEALGLGPLEELLRDTTITEIMVNRFDQVYVERLGKITLSDKRFIDNNHVIQVIRRIIAPLGRRIDESAPLVEQAMKCRTTQAMTDDEFVAAISF